MAISVAPLARGYSVPWTVRRCVIIPGNMARLVIELLRDLGKYSPPTKRSAMMIADVERSILHRSSA